MSNGRRKINREKQRKIRVEATRRAEAALPPTLTNLNRGYGTAALLRNLPPGGTARTVARTAGSQLHVNGNVTIFGCKMPDLEVVAGPNANLTVAATLVGSDAVDHLNIATRSTDGAGAAVAATASRSVASATGSTVSGALDEQRRYLDMLRAHLSVAEGTPYDLESEVQQGTGVGGDASIDGVLRAGERRVAVQVVHVSPALAAQLGRTAEALEVEITHDSVKEAIRAKALDSSRAQKALLLICPVAIGRPFREALVSRPLDAMGYGEVWLCDSDGPPLRLASRS